MKLVEVFSRFCGAFACAVAFLAASYGRSREGETWVAPRILPALAPSI